MYESTKDEIKKKKKIKIEQNKGLSRTTYDVENDLGGLTNITNQSEIPNRSVAFEIKKLLDNQTSNTLRAFLGLESHYAVCEEFDNHCMEFIVFSQLTCDEKDE